MTVLLIAFGALLGIYLCWALVYGTLLLGWILLRVLTAPFRR